MAFFWFIIVVVLLIIISRRKTPESSEDRYAQGYWDGYRAAGERVADVLTETEVNRDALQAIVDEGSGVVRADSTREITQDATHMAEYSSETEATVQLPIAAESSLTPEERSLRNLNAVLYMGSFLLVAAATTFIAAAMPAGVRLAGLIAVVVLFYGAGIVLHVRVPRLRPAAVAFVGTGLAILPFVGVALHLLGGVSGAAAWFVVSLVGVAAYAVAAVVLQSQVVSYLTMAFVLSLVSSAVATASLPIVWYFVALISVSLLANVISFLWPQRLPGLFRQPIEQTGQIVTPLAVVASVCVASQMTMHMFEVLFLVVSAHYLVVWLQQRQYWQAAAVRGLLYVTFLLFVGDVAHGVAAIFWSWWLIGAIAQAVLSLWLSRHDDAVTRRREHGWTVVAASMVGFGACWWPATAHPALGVTVSLSVLGLLSVAAFWRFQLIGWAYAGLLVSGSVVFVVARWLVTPSWPWAVVVSCFAGLAGLSLAGYARYTARARSAGVTQFLAVVTLSYALLMVISGLLAHDALTLGWALLLTAAVVTGVSYVAQDYHIEAIAGILGVGAIFVLVDRLPVWAAWHVLMSVGLSVALLAAATWWHHRRGEGRRRTALLVLGMIVPVLLVGGATQPLHAVAATSLLALLAGAVVSLLLRRKVRHEAWLLSRLFTGGYASYLVLAWILSLALPAEWQVLTYAVAATMLWAASYVERLPALTLGGNILLVVMIARLWDWLQLDANWAVFGVAWLAAGLLYGIYWLMLERADAWRQWGCLASVWVILGVAAGINFSVYPLVQQVAAAASIVVIGVTLAIQGYLVRNRDLVEGAAYIVTIGLQRVVGIAIPEANVVLYAHWWALTIIALGWWRGLGQRSLHAIAAMAVLSAGVGSQALVTSSYQVLFLVEHLGLLVAGVMYRRQWAIWWGIGASVVAVLYFLRNYTFLWLGFLGLVLIGIVVWRLGRTGRQAQ